METIINLIIQLIAGVAGGNAAGAALKDYNLVKSSAAALEARSSPSLPGW